MRFLLLFLSLGLVRFASALECPHYKIQGDFQKFSSGEETLLCGDESLVEWNRIPQKQIKIHLENILFNRGYPHPKVWWSSAKQLSFKLGRSAKLESLVLEGFPPKLREEIRQNILLEGTLDQGRVSSIEAGIKTLLASRGYLCAKLNIRADLNLNRVTVSVKDVELARFGRVLSKDNAKFETLKRFEAFEEGWLFDQRLVELSERRIRASNFVSNVFYYSSCSSDQNLESIERVVFPGPSKFISFGFGFDTEEYFLIKGKYENVRLTDDGAKFNTGAFASFRFQELKTGFEDPVLEPEDRLKVLYELSINREEEDNYEIVSANFSPKLVKFLQFKPLSLSLAVGPYLERQWNLEGLGKKNARIIGLDAFVVVESTLHEYYAQQPRSGFLLSSSIKTSHRDFYSDYDAHLVKNNFEVLFLLSDSPKVDYVLGARVKWDFLLSYDESANRELVSPKLFNFLGGSSDLRGFARKQLGTPNGRASALYLGLELRAAGYNSIQPFLFYDVGKLGDAPFAFDSNFYASPGFGLRLGTSFGTFRATAGLGYENTWLATNGERTHMQFFLSFGEEF
ncbi:hypothetical protein GW915_06325 [bacterium]|nr:hypothetical protein [bacterium]